MAVDSSAGRARITMPSGALVALDARAEHLDVTVEAASEAQLDETVEAVAVHLDRFAFREGPLRFGWVRSVG